MIVYAVITILGPIILITMVPEPVLLKTDVPARSVFRSTLSEIGGIMVWVARRSQQSGCLTEDYDVIEYEF